MLAYMYYIPILSIPLTCLIFRNNEKKNDIALFVSATTVFLLLALRSYSLGVDIVVYKDVFEYLKTFSFGNMIKGSPVKSMEPGYIWLNWIIAKTTGSFRVLLVIQSLLCVSSCVFLCRKYSVNPVISFFLLCCSGIIDFPIDIIRQSFV